MTADEILSWVERNGAETSRTSRPEPKSVGVTFAELPEDEKSKDGGKDGKIALGEGQSGSSVVTYKTVTETVKRARVALPRVGFVAEGATLEEAIENMRTFVRELSASVLA